MDTPDTDARIVAAAMKLFEERGYAATTTRAIAESAGVNEVTLFRRFGTKAGVLAAIGRVWEQTGPPPTLDDTTDVRGTLLRWAQAEVATAKRSGAFMLRMAFDARSVPEVAQALASGRGPAGALDALADYFTRAAAAGVVRADVDPRVLAEGFQAMTSSTVMYRQMMGVLAGEPRDVIAALVDLFCDGALAR